MESLVINQDFWHNRTVFITGHTGFKGSWLALWLKQLGANVVGYALEPLTSPVLFENAKVIKAIKQHNLADIRDLNTLSKAMQDCKPEIVIHLAAQPLVRESYENPLNTYSTNVMGTVNLFEAVRNVSTVKAVLNITTDKCYENKEWLWGYRENEAMGGFDPYSSSKACSELVSSAYRQSFFQQQGIALATARAGNVIGGGDWGKDRIVPDAMRAFIENRPLLIRNPMAIRPWQHVLDALSGYLMLCQQLMQYPDKFSEAWNFGPNEDDAQPVSKLADIMVNSWGGKAAWEGDKGEHPHESLSLRLDCSKAKAQLKWKPIWNLERALGETVNWYKAWYNKKDMQQFTLDQIRTYHQEHQGQ